MNILLINTAAERLSVGVYSDGKIFSSGKDAVQREHSAYINSCIKEAMENAGVTFSELDAYACVVGPGSFTGLRVGIATVKGLAVVYPRPFVAVNSLELPAYNESDAEVSMDAGRDRIYFGEKKDGKLVLPVTLTGAKETAFRYDLKKDYLNELGEISAEKFGNKDFAERLSPVYVQLCQAENEFFARHDQVVVRKATAGDLGNLLEIERLCFADDPWTAEMFLCELEEPTAGLFIASIKGETAGFAEVRFDGEQLYLGNIGVRPNYRGKGIATKLLTEIFTDYVKKGAQNCFLHVRTGNENAIALYKSLGFTAVREIKDYYPRKESAYAMLSNLEKFRQPSSLNE